MIKEHESPWAKPLVAAELGRRLHQVAHLMKDVISQQYFPAQLLMPLNHTLRQQGKLLASNASKGHPIIVEDLSLWSLPVILAHAAASDTSKPKAPRSSWYVVAPVAAAAEFLGLALDLIDDIQDGDGAIIQQLSMPIALNVAVALLGLSNAAIEGSSILPLWQRPLHTMFTSAMLVATGGQYLDLIYEQRRHITINESIDMTARKSGSLIGLLFQVGAFVGFSAKFDVDRAITASGDFAQLGSLLGIIAQLENDLHDAFSTDSTNLKSDRVRHKKTLPLVFEAESLTKKELSADEIIEAAPRFVRYMADMYRIQALDILAKLVTNYSIRAGTLSWLITEREALS